MAKRDVQKSLRRKAAEKRMEKKHEDKMAKQMNNLNSMGYNEAG